MQWSITAFQQSGELKAAQMLQNQPAGQFVEQDTQICVNRWCAETSNSSPGSEPTLNKCLHLLSESWDSVVQNIKHEFLENVVLLVILSPLDPIDEGHFSSWAVATHF